MFFTQLIPRAFDFNKLALARFSRPNNKIGATTSKVTIIEAEIPKQLPELFGLNAPDQSKKFFQVLKIGPT